MGWVLNTIQHKYDTMAFQGLYSILFLAYKTKKFYLMVIKFPAYTSKVHA